MQRIDLCKGLTTEVRQKIEGSIAVGLSENVAPWRAWWTNFGSVYELLSSSALFSLGGLFAVIFSISGPAGTLFLVLPLLLAHDSYRRYLARADAAKAKAADRRAA